MNRLFVYGTFAPGQANHKVLDGIAGTWESATMRGHLVPEGWGAAMGYPAIVPSAEGDEVDGFVFSSAGLEEHWSRLDAFGGDAYERVSAIVRIGGDREVEAHVYALRRSDLPGSLMELAKLDWQGLKTKHRRGVCPNVADLHGAAYGRMDHDLPGNPGWVRRFHDEMVEMKPGLYLTSSHWKTAGRLRYLSYFAFSFAGG